MNKRPISGRRRRFEAGDEAIEFALFFTLALPMFVWMFINGMNFIILDKVNDVTRAAGLMLVKSQDFTLSGTQDIVARVATGLNMQVGTTGGITGTTTGNGLVVISKVEYVGATTCSNCTNVGKYVFLNRIYVGNKSLQFNGSAVDSNFGDPASALWGPNCTVSGCSTTSGDVANYLTDARAQTNASFASLFTDPTTGSTVAIADSQVVYVVESYFSSPNGFGAGQFGSGGVYARALM